MSTPVTPVTSATPVVLVVEHEDGTGPGWFGERLVAAGLTLDLRRPWKGDELPASLDGFAGLVVLGGSPGPYDDTQAPWLSPTRGLLRAAVAADLPTFGICLGAELLTVACGGEVVHAALPEVGPVTVTLTEEGLADPLFAPVGPSARAVQWHWEEIGTLPAGAVPLATSERCRYQALRMGSRVWAVQFHPEVLTAAVREWAGHDAGRLPALGTSAESLVRDVTALEDDLRSTWGALADRWAAVVAT